MAPVERRPLIWALHGNSGRDDFLPLPDGARHSIRSLALIQAVGQSVEAIGLLEQQSFCA
jgi:hypothetical protein